jgi:hypothetical protein
MVKYRGRSTGGTPFARTNFPLDLDAVNYHELCRAVLNDLTSHDELLMPNDARNRPPTSETRRVPNSEAVGRSGSRAG